MGSSHGALVVRVSSVEGTLDAAVAEVRAVLDRVREGSLTEADRNRATLALAASDLAASIDPKGRLVALWNGHVRGGTGQPPFATRVPSLAVLRAFAASTLQNQALVIVASRPPRDFRASLPSSRSP